MNLTRTLFLALAFLIPTASTMVAKADDKPAAEGEKAPAKKAKKSTKKEEPKKEEAPAK